MTIEELKYTYRTLIKGFREYLESGKQGVFHIPQKELTQILTKIDMLEMFIEALNKLEE